MSDPDEAFFALFGEEATEAQRRRILEVQEALGLRRSDSLWSVFLALGYFQHDLRNHAGENSPSGQRCN